MRELSRSQPINIGRAQFNEICVDERDVASLHCRISWNKTRFEVSAATPGGVEVNSATVAHANLKQGDVIRIGSLDLYYYDEVPQASAHTPSPGPEHGTTRKSKPKSDPKPETKQEPSPDDLSLFDGQILTESQANLDALFSDVKSEDSSEFEWDKKDKKKSPTPVPTPSLLAPAVRPGEQDILRSPLVLGLTGGGLALLLITGIFWFLISREQSNRMYDRAVQEMNDGQFAQAIATYELFIKQNPNHALRRSADRGLGKTLVMKEIAGASPTWKRGLERMNELIKAHRNESDFADLHSSLFQFAEQISMGSAKSAELARDPELLVISKTAQDLLERYADPSSPPTGTINRINDQRVKAERAIEKQKTFDQAMATVDAAIADRKPMAALSHRERLVKQFPDFISSKRVKDALQKALDLERSVVSTDETERPAETSDNGQPTISTTLGIVHSRSRTDEQSQGRVAFVMAKDCCYAIDTVTGELVWRRIVGFDAPFFPTATTGAQPAVLLFDTRTQSLLSCRVTDGKLIWRQPLSANALGKPLVHEGQIYLPLDGNALVRIDVDSGRLTASVKLSQNLASTPVLSRDGNYLLVPGRQAMIYSLALRTSANRPPLSAAAMTFTDHAAGSIVAPPLSMGRLLLLCENDRADSARLRLWDAGNPADALTELASTRTFGQVRDVPVLRGNQLVVPFAGERFTAFAVTDEAGRAGIAQVGEYGADQSVRKDRLDAPMFLALGPDGQFWSAGTAFRRFEISSKGISMDSNATAQGIASQPLQMIGEQFFVGRKTRNSDAVTFSAIDREKLVNPWRVVVGDRPQEMTATRDGGLTWVGQSGALYSIGKNRLNQGGVDLKAGTELELPANLSRPLQVSVLHDQRLAVAAMGETIQLLLLNPAGQVVGNHRLDQMPETDPVLLDEGLVVPLPARLKVLNLTPGAKMIQDWIAPVGETLEHHWEYLIRLDGREFIACERSGRLQRIQFRQGDVPHLAEVAKLQLDKPMDVRPFLRGEFLYVVDADGLCRQLNVHSFDTDGQHSLPAPVKNLWPIGTNTLALAGDGKLHSLADGKEMPEQWTFDLKSLQPLGIPIIKDDMIWLGCRDGTVLVLNPTTGAEIRRVSVPQSLSIGLRQAGELLYAVATDGTLYRME